MKKLFLYRILIFIPTATFAQATETSSIMPEGWTDGSGGKIENLANLRWLSETGRAWDENWVQTSNIDASETILWNIVDHDNDASTDSIPMGFQPISWNSNISNTFTGSYNGQGHIISNLYIHSSHGSEVGLWGNISHSKIENVVLENAQICGNYDVGGLVGYSYKSVISNCNVTGTIKANGNTGGIIGSERESDICNCTSRASISSGNDAGGIAGISYYGNYNLCKGLGTVAGENDVGSLIGDITNGSITICEGSGGCSGMNRIGGLAGSASTTTIKGCSSETKVEGNSAVGGLIGTCLYNTSISESSSSAYVYAKSNRIGGLIGGTWSDATITDCNTTGLVYAPNSDGVGGLIGSIWGGSNEGTIIKYCNAIGLVDGNMNVGGLIGEAFFGKIKECYSIAIINGTENVGGLAGYFAGTILNCFTTGLFIGNDKVGGLVGGNIGELFNVFSTGYMKGSTSLGGIVGLNSGDIVNSFSRGIIVGDEKLGGIVGSLGFGSGIIMNAFASGTILTTQMLPSPIYVGGIIGKKILDHPFTNCFYDYATTGVKTAIGLSSEDMTRSANTDSMGLSTEDFYNKGLGFPVGKDDDNPWVIDKNGRPYFYWQKASVNNSSVDTTTSFISVSSTENSTKLLETGVRYRLESQREWITQPLGNTSGCFTGEMKGIHKDSIYHCQGYAIDTAYLYYYGDMIRFKSSVTANGIIPPPHSSPLKIKLYPNPVSDILFIESRSKIDLIRIYNAKGQILSDGATTGRKQSHVNVSRFSEGNYLIQIRTDGECILKKIQVKHE
jgi:hypothetical protein